MGFCGAIDGDNVVALFELLEFGAVVAALLPAGSQCVAGVTALPDDAAGAAAGGGPAKVGVPVVGGGAKVGVPYCGAAAIRG
jgi:hypothetical protein